MSKLVRFDPFREIDALQRQFLGEDWMTKAKGIHFPTTDIYTDDDKQLTVESHLPNFEEKDIDINVDDGALVIQAEKHEKQEEKNRKYVVRETSSSFYRRIQLPERANTEDIKASLKNGVLKVVVPLTALPEPKKIAISSETKNDKK